MNCKQTEKSFFLSASILLLLLLTHLPGYSQKNSNACPLSTIIGNEKICLPELSGMIESYSDPEIMKYVDARTMRGNINLAFYSDSNTYTTIKYNSKSTINDYIIVYSLNDLENARISASDIHFLDSSITSNYNQYLNDYWGLIIDSLKQKVSGVNLDQPVLIEHYQTGKDIPCIITLGRATFENSSHVFLTATVLREIRGKFLAFAWYSKYEDQNSLKKLKANVDYFNSLVSQMNLVNQIPENNFDISIDPKLEKAVNLFNSAYKESSEGNFAEAISLYSNAIALYPESEKIKLSEAYFNRGLNKRYLNDLSGAITDYTEAIKMRPDYFKAYNNRGFAKLRKRDFQGAILDFSVIINHNPPDKNLIGAAYGSRAMAKHALGLDACPDFKTAKFFGMNIYESYLKECK